MKLQCQSRYGADNKQLCLILRNTTSIPHGMLKWPQTCGRGDSCWNRSITHACQKQLKEFVCISLQIANWLFEYSPMNWIFLKLWLPKFYQNTYLSKDAFENVEVIKKTSTSILKGISKKVFKRLFRSLLYWFLIKWSFINYPILHQSLNSSSNV